MYLTPKERIKVYKKAKEILIDSFTERNWSFLCGIFKDLLDLPSMDHSIVILPEFGEFEPTEDDEFYLPQYSVWFNIWGSGVNNNNTSTPYLGSLRFWQLERLMCMDFCILMAKEAEN